MRSKWIEDMEQFDLAKADQGQGKLNRVITFSAFGLDGFGHRLTYPVGKVVRLGLKIKKKPHVADATADGYVTTYLSLCGIGRRETLEEAGQRLRREGARKGGGDGS